MIMDTMLQNIPQRLHEVNTLLATCRQGVFSFGEALPLSLFYRDFSDTNLLVKEAVCLVKENPGRLLDFSSSLLLETETYLSLGRPLCMAGHLKPPLVRSHEGGNLSGMASWKRQQQQQERRREMKRIYTVMEYVPLLAGMLMLLSSCEHKDLCFDHDPHAPKSEVRVEAEYEKEWQYTYENGTDWKNYPTWQESFGMEYDALRPGIPDGLRMQVYNADGSDEIVNIAPEGEVVYMRPGEHSLLFYNNDTEYIVFDEMQSFASAKATTRTRTRSSYLGNSYMDTKDENTVNQPDMLYGSYMESYVAERSTETDVIPVTMHPLVFTYLVRYEFSHGVEYVSLARGALAGMAQAVWLNSGHTSDEAATVLYDCTVEDFGTQALVRSFGIPDFPNEHYGTRAERKYGLNLEVRLKNGKIKSFDFDVTDQVAAQPQGGVIVVKGIEISDEEGTEGGSGFDVDVEDWGDYEDIELPL